MKKLIKILITIGLVLGITSNVTGCGCKHEEVTTATCIAPVKCLSCGKEIGEKNPEAHEWEDATLNKPKTCALCGITEGNPLELYGDCIPDFEDVTGAPLLNTDDKDTTICLMYDATNLSYDKIVDYAKLLIQDGFSGEELGKETDTVGTVAYGSLSYSFTKEIDGHLIQIVMAVYVTGDSSIGNFVGIAYDKINEN